MVVMKNRYEEQFQRKLKQAVKEIIEESQNRKCGNCEYYYREECNIHRNALTDKPIACKPTSIACIQHKIIWHT